MQERETEDQAQDDEATRQPKATAAAPKKSSGLLPFMVDALVVVVIAVIASFAVVRYAPQDQTERPPEPQKFAYVDMERLSREHILGLTEQARSGEIDAEEITKRTREFAQALMAGISAASEQGVIVFNANALVSVPATTEDLTQTLQEQLQKSGQMAIRKSKQASP